MRRAKPTTADTYDASVVSFTFAECVDEKSQMQAVDRSQPVLPMMPGMPERRTHDYARHGTTSLFAAFNIADGTVISELYRRHRATEFKKFLVTIDKTVPAELEVHLVCDNLATHKTPTVNEWLARYLSLPCPFHPVSNGFQAWNTRPCFEVLTSATRQVALVYEWGRL
jgi:hypothetical protein